MLRFLIIPLHLFFLFSVENMMGQDTDWYFDNETCQKMYHLNSKYDRFDCTCEYTLHNTSRSDIDFTLVPDCECSKVLVLVDNDWLEKEVGSTWTVNARSDIRIKVIFSTTDKSEEIHLDEYYPISKAAKKRVRVGIKFLDNKGQTDLLSDFYFKWRSR
jgi:hypothetical protein